MDDKHEDFLEKERIRQMEDDLLFACQLQIEEADLIEKLYKEQLRREELQKEQIRREEEELKRKLEKEKQDLIRKKENEERMRIREEQDREYNLSLQEALQAKKNQEKQEKHIIPEHFICPITKEIMTIPMCNKETNISYEKTAILKYLKNNNNKCPLNNNINISNLFINNELKNEIGIWKRENPDWNKK